MRDMSTKQIGIGVAVVVAVAVVGFFLGDKLLNTSAVTPSLSNNSSSASGGLVVQDEVVGTGAQAQNGDVLVVAYTGKFQNGTVFDTSVGKAAIPITPCPAGTTTGLCMTLGAHQVIQGWEQGLQGMKVGGKRLITVPPELGYGPQDYGPIPGNSTLIFEVELLAVKSNQ